MMVGLDRVDKVARVMGWRGEKGRRELCSAVVTDFAGLEPDS
jgi:hypothetical protein